MFGEFFLTRTFTFNSNKKNEIRICLDLNIILKVCSNLTARLKKMHFFLDI